MTKKELRREKRKLAKKLLRQLEKTGISTDLCTLKEEYLIVVRQLLSDKIQQLSDRVSAISETLHAHLGRGGDLKI